MKKSCWRRFIRFIYASQVVPQSAFPQLIASGGKRTLHFLHRVAQKSVNLKHFLVLTGTFKFKPASQLIERYLIAVSCVLNMEDLISKIVLNLVIYFYLMHILLTI
jgi:hypothetical protein